MTRYKLALLGTLAAPAVSFAAVPEAVTTAMTAAVTDSVAMATLLLPIAAGVVAIMIGVKFIKRIKGAV
jgi:hypothetical protein